MNWNFAQIYIIFILALISVCAFTVIFIVMGITSAVKIKKAAEIREYKCNVVKTIIFSVLEVIGITAVIAMLLIGAFISYLLSGRIVV